MPALKSIAQETPCEATRIGNDTMLLPVDIIGDGETAHVLLFRLPRIYFRDPFFVETLYRHTDILYPVQSKDHGSHWASPFTPQLAYNPVDPRLVRMTIPEFLQYSDELDIGSMETFFVFHMSRCGSTLLTQMLSSSDRFFVVSQPIIVNSALDRRYTGSYVDRSALTRAVLRCLVACAPRQCRYAVIKFESWNALYLEELLQTGVAQKWAFLHRNGVEVMVSIAAMPPLWLRNRSRIEPAISQHIRFDGDEEAVRLGSDNEYCARMLGAFCLTAAQKRGSHASYINYSSLPSAIFPLLSEQWGVSLSSTEIDAMVKRAERHSKDPAQVSPFVPDSHSKRKKADAGQILLAEKFIEPFRARLF
ncbi:hypothetical protein D3C80_981980 [compost metagenome]